MLRIIMVLALVAPISACAQHPVAVYTLLDGRLEVAVPESYMLYERPDRDRVPERANKIRPVEFVRFGGNAALARKFPDNPFGADFLDHFAGKDVQASIEIVLIDLIPTGDPGEWRERDGRLVVPRDADARAIHELYCEHFTARWTEFSFAYFDPATGIGSCVNFAGAFIAVFTRRVGDTLIFSLSMDFVEVLIVEKKGPGKAVLDMTAAENWEVFRAAANADVAEQVLLSATVR